MKTFKECHRAIFDVNVIKEELKTLNEFFHGRGFYFGQDIPDSGMYYAYKQEEVPENTLIILVSFDFSYYHDAEICFYNVSYHNLQDDGWRWPDHWTKSQLELIEGNERENFLLTNNIPCSNKQMLFAFNVGSHGDKRFYVVAEGISNFIGTVFYHDMTKERELESNERLAIWLR